MIVRHRQGWRGSRTHARAVTVENTTRTFVASSLVFATLVASQAARAEGEIKAASLPTALEAPVQDPAVPEGILQIPDSSNFYSPYAFVVDKKSRTLSVWQQTANGLKQVASFPADMGANTGAKLKWNDKKTPEGIYYLLERRDAPALDFNIYGQRAFTTDYPNFFDRSEGKTGDGIWLHAVPDHVALTRGSAGCVVVRNDVIAEITKYVKLGRTPMLIEEHADLKPSKEVKARTDEVNKWLEGWRSSWENKDIASYINDYSPNFRALHMNRNQWQKYKDRLNHQYKSIAVRISRPTVFLDRNRAVIRFLQEYTSDRKSDVGEKVLYVQKNGDSYQILGETWAEETSELARQEIAQSKSTTSVTCTEKDGTDCVHAATAHQ